MFTEDKNPRPGHDEDRWPGLCSAVAHDLMALAVLHHGELDTALVEDLRCTGFPNGLRLQLRSDQGQEAVSLVGESLQALPETVDKAALDELAADYADIYLTHALGASPCESVWIDEEGLAMQEPMFQVREYYRRHGLNVRDWRKRSDDHLVHQLQFLSLLFARAGREHLVEAARFMDEHLLRWLPGFAARVASRCATPLYAGLAMLSMAYADELRDLLAEILGESRPSAEEIEERMRPRVTAEVPPPAYVPGAGPTW